MVRKKKQKFISVYQETGKRKPDDLKFKKSVKRKNIKKTLTYYRNKGFDVRKKQKNSKDIYVIF